jgi:hypothetical protein
VRFNTLSARFGLIGVFVVMAACAAIGLTLGSNQANPKLALGLIFGVIAIYLVILFTLQSRDVEAATGADRGTAGRGPGPVENPTTMSESELWSAMAVKPIGPEAAKARSETFAMARSSIRLGMLICVLIFAGVVPLYLFDTFIPFLICAPLIGLIALFKSFSLLRGGGDVDQAYERAGTAVEPLGLKMTARPDVGIEPRPTPPYSFKTRISGPLVMEGNRHGRPVSVVNDGGASEVTVGSRSPEFETKARDGRIRLGKDGPAAVRDALERVPSSTRWSGVTVSGDADGIVVKRKRDGGGDFLCDLWLAELIAGAQKQRKD